MSKDYKQIVYETSINEINQRLTIPGGVTSIGNSFVKDAKSLTSQRQVRKK